MLLVPCPYCGDRAEVEFSYGGEAHIIRPETPGDVADDAWCDYVFMRTNPKGFYRERWRHISGCGRYFYAIRHTVSDTIHVTYKIGEPLPPFPPTESAPPRVEPRLKLVVSDTGEHS